MSSSSSAPPCSRGEEGVSPVAILPSLPACTTPADKRRVHWPADSLGRLRNVPQVSELLGVIHAHLGGRGEKRKVSASRRPPGMGGHRGTELFGQPWQPQRQIHPTQRFPDMLVLGFPSPEALPLSRVSRSSLEISSPAENPASVQTQPRFMPRFKAPFPWRGKQLISFLLTILPSSSTVRKDPPSRSPLFHCTLHAAPHSLLPALFSISPHMRPK